MKKHSDDVNGLNGHIDTVWEVWSYDVWGNQKDGWEVNDRSCDHRAYPITLKLEICNPGTPQEFQSASPTDKQIREALQIKPRVKIDLGDDVTIYVEHESTGYPLGELFCVSHESLSPPKAKEE